MREQVLRALQQAHVLLRRRELDAVTFGRRCRLANRIGRGGVDNRRDVALQFRTRAGVVDPVFGAVARGELASARREGLDKASPARRARDGDADGLGTEELDAVGNGGFGSESADDTKDLALRPVFRKGQELEVVLLGQVRSEHHDCGEVKLAVGNLLEDDGKRSRHPGRAGAPKRGVFREAQLVQTICIEARAGAEAMDAARFDLCEASEKRREELVGATDQTARTGEQLGIRDMLEPLPGFGIDGLRVGNSDSRVRSAGAAGATVSVVSWATQALKFSLTKCCQEESEV